MATKIYQDLFGFFVFDAKNKLIKVVKYSNNPEEIAEKLFQLERYNNSAELQQITAEMEESEIKTNSKSVLEYIKSIDEIKCSLETTSKDHIKIKTQIPTILLEKGIIKEEKNYSSTARQVGIALSKKRVAVASQRTDKMVVHAILSMDDISTTINLFVGRIREWYGIHFPEILKQVENHETLCKIIKNIGIRDDFTEKKLKQLGFSSEKSKKLVQRAKNSMGAQYDSKDLQPLLEVVERTLELYDQKNRLEQWIDNQIDRIAPNMKALVGGSITARLIALAGGLKEMAMMPASTVQLLGAEKALFRALKTGAKPPKHGVIYQTPELHSCPWWQRGNIARAIAGKLSIASRVDAFQGEFIGNELKLDLDRKIAEIKQKYDKPPEGKKEPTDYDYDRRKQKPRGKRPPQKRRSKGKKTQSYSKKKQNYSKKKQNYSKKKQNYSKKKKR